ncbi:MAG: hypothetical protein WB729_21075 [Candidatus Sulfotelmatobacter sp.]
MRHLVNFILRFVAAALATCVSMILVVLVFWAIGGFLFHMKIINDATLFAFPLYGLLPGFIVGGVWYAIIMVGKQNSK